MKMAENMVNRRTQSIACVLLSLGVMGILSTVAVGARILPLHISAAVCSYLFFAVCMISCFLKKQKFACFVGIASCEAGLLNAVVTLISGMSWAHSSWGVFWVWEPRLTGMLLTTMFFISWRIAVGILGETAVWNRSLTSSLLILGIPAMIFTHIAVRLFGGIHPSSVSSLNALPVEGWMFVTMGGGVLGISGAFFTWRLGKLTKSTEVKEKLKKKFDRSDEIVDKAARSERS